MTAVKLELVPQGHLTLPQSLRDQYGLGDGHLMTLVDIGGVFLVSPRPISVDASADSMRDGLLASGATLEGMLADIRQRREADGTS